MNIKIIAIGKMTDSALRRTIDNYIKQCRWTVTIQEIIPKKIAATNNYEADALLNKKYQYELIVDALPQHSLTIALDEKGQNWTSQEFAGIINNHFSKNVTFIIGGADGIDSNLFANVHHVISFGKLTWPHMLARLMLIEQIYRADKILCGHPYHRQ